MLPDLPYSCRINNNLAAPNENSMNESRKRILHLEDDHDMQDYVQALLSDIADITSIDTAEQFSRLLDENTFDLFLLDLVLQDGSGSSMAKVMKATYPEIPIIMLSAHYKAGTIEEVDASFTKGAMNETEFIDSVIKFLN